MLRAWERPYWSVRFQPCERVRSVLILRARATIVTPVATVRGVASHEEDDIVLATADAGNAAYLVTGDYGLQRLGTFEGITIASPWDFLSVLEERETRQA